MGNSRRPSNFNLYLICHRNLEEPDFPFNANVTDLPANLEQPGFFSNDNVTDLPANFEQPSKPTNSQNLMSFEESLDSGESVPNGPTVVENSPKLSNLQNIVAEIF